MSTNTPGIQLFTAEDLLRMPDDGFRYELVKGELRKMAPPGAEHGGIVAILVESLGSFVRKNNLGKVYVETGFQLASDPDTVRSADVAFIHRERVEAAGKITGYWQGAPDLTIEVISPNDRYTDVDDKVLDWLHAGTRMVIVINPRNNTAAVYRGPSQVVRLTESDILDGNEVVPGWRMPVRDLF
jgi:Uma2 family endonuclease